MTRFAFRLSVLLFPFALAACRVDVDHLQSLIPADFTVTETLSSESKRFNCQRATFIASAPPGATEDWTRLGRLFDAKLSACIELEEQLRWKQAIARQTAWWRVIQAPERAHIWYDSESGRLQVLTLQQDR
ncbi:hypothetical protein [Sagittula stellata]|uniref:Lipoprotein n=1 Tax=Sagittula stellata (strain ATCC 700073 / DSM 11524 / E-37) TaxID=388399 RepID=A3K6H4_SAGS3|nr:hypothetical protein [Sagittula stellata]EBA07324.1 hypothetical protein SSE37_06794 [Sagittula stellata E-37]